MELHDISATDLETLKSQGYDDSDLEMLDKTEVDALLGRNRLGEGLEDETPPAQQQAPGVDPHDAAARAQDEAAAAAEAAGNVATPPSDGGAAPAPTAGPTHVQGFVTQYDVESVDADKAKIGELRTEERAAFKRLMDGEIDAEEYQKIKDRTESEAEALRERVLEARLLTSMNQRNAEADAKTQWQNAQSELLPQFKAAGLDYAKPTLLVAFNHHLKTLAADPKNGARDARWFLTEANRLVAEDLGVTVQASKGAGKTPGGVDMRSVPPTLRSVPAAGSNVIQSDEFADLDRIMEHGNPLEQERAVAALTPQQRERWLAR